MKAIVTHETGDPDVLRYEEVERPEPGEDEVLIKVLAASVNPIDWKYRRGVAEKQLPAVLGLGADRYVDYTKQDVAEAVSDVDVALDTVGGETTESLLPTLREGGILVTIANAPPTEAAGERGARADLLVMSPSPEQLAR